MDNEKLISPYISSQFPAHYRENYPQFVEFVRMYYTWLEQGDQAVGHARHLQEYRDIDETPEEYISYFKNKYLPYIKFITSVDKRTLVKHVQDLYRAKGTERGVDLFFKLVYGVDADVYYPSTDLFRLSDNIWVKRNYLEIGHLELIGDYIGKQIYGTRSGATAFAERFIQKKVGPKYINILFISNMVGDFMYNEKIAYVGITDSDRKRPRVIGSLTKLDITTGSKDFKVGDLVKIESAHGYGATGRVANVYNTSGLVDFQLVDGGWGYTAEVEDSPYLSGPKVWISDKVMTIKDIDVDIVPNNPGEAPYVASPYFALEKVYQPLYSFEYKFDKSLQQVTVAKPGASWFANGATVYQRADGTNTAVGVIVSNSSLNTSAQNLIIRIDVSDPALKDFYTTSDTYGNIYLSTSASVNSLVLSSNLSTNIFSVETGTVLRSYNDLGAVVSSVEVVGNEILSLNDKTANVFVYVYSGNVQTNTYFWSTGNTYSINVDSYADKTATGNVIGVSNTFTLFISNSTNNFAPGQYLTQRRIYPGGYDISAKGMIAGIVGAANTFTVQVTGSTGVFQKNVNVYMQYANGLETSQSAYLNSYDGQIGVANIFNDFVVTGNNKIYTRGWTRDANNDLIIYGSNSVANLVLMSTGKGATFRTSNTLAYAESYSLYTDFVGGNNELSVPYMDLRLSNSTGYSNALILTFSAGATALEVSRYGNAYPGTFTAGSNSVANINTAPFYAGDVISVYKGDGSHYLDVVNSVTNATHLRLQTNSTFTGSANIYFAGTSTINTSMNWWVSGNNLGDFNELVSVPNSTHIVVTTASSNSSSGRYYLTPTDGIPWYFPKNQAGSIEWIIDDVLNSLNGYVGQITQLVAVNPGEDYNQAPFVLVQDPFTFGFNARDYILTCSDITGSFIVGEQIAQSNGARGLIKSITILANGNRVLYVRRQNLPIGSIDTGMTTQFTVDGEIEGLSTGSTATIIGVDEDDSRPGIGLNAVVTSNVVIGNGVVGKIDILASGFGFRNLENADFISEDGLRAGTAKINLIKQGVTDGIHSDEASFLSSSKYLFDGDYYQEYSYDIKAPVPRKSYYENYNATMHMSGTKMFSTYVYSAVNDLSINISLPEGANLIADTI